MLKKQCALQTVPVSSYRYMYRCNSVYNFEFKNRMFYTFIYFKDNSYQLQDFSSLELHIRTTQDIIISMVDFKFMREIFEIFLSILHVHTLREFLIRFDLIKGYGPQVWSAFVINNSNPYHCFSSEGPTTGGDSILVGLSPWHDIDIDHSTHLAATSRPS